MVDKYDSITIGDFVTERRLEQGIINTDGINKAYNLNYREDKNAQDVDVKNAGTEDDSKVYQVMAIPFDRSNAFATLDVEHWFIHKGLHFFSSELLEIPALSTFQWVVETGDRAPHMSFEVSPTNGGVEIVTYEGITANEDGTLCNCLNNNRLSTNLPTVEMRLNPTGVSITGAQMIRKARIGTTGGTSQRTGGNLARTNEVVFKKNTKYLLEIENLNNETAYVNLLHSWYENGL